MICGDCVRQRFLVFLLALVIASACNWSVKCRPGFIVSTDLRTPLLVREFIPERLRSFLAACLWSRADNLMHQGSSYEGSQSFKAGSYAGNTDIIPLLQMVILLMPEEVAPYQLLATNLSRYMGLPCEGLRIIQRGIMINKGNPSLHELYAAAAFVKLFGSGPLSDDNRCSALKYLSKATKIWSEESSNFSSDPAFKPQNYAILSARLLLELQKPDEALAIWITSGLELDTERDRLAVVLREYRDNGKIPGRADFVDEAGLSEVRPEINGLEKEGEKEAALPYMPILRLLTGAGLLVLALNALSWRLTRG